MQVLLFHKGFKQLCILSCVLSVLDGFGQSQLLIQASGITSVKGQLLYSLFRSADGFPGNAGKAFKKGAVPVTDRSVQFLLESLPPGDYALSLVHDRNSNGQLDMSAMGIPQESIGFSNNVMGAFGPPKFNRARFTLQSGRLELPVIRLRNLP